MAAASRAVFMARQPCFVLSAYPQHVIQHGNNRHVIFADEADVHSYRDTLIEASRRFHCRVDAYVQRHGCSADRFRLKIEGMLQRQVRPGPRGMTRYRRDLPGKEKAIESDPIDHW